MNATSPLDEALQHLAGFGPSLTSGLVSHAPMVVEALARLHRGAAIPSWLAANEATFVSREAVSGGAARPAIGDGGGFADWAAWFGQELAANPWREVVDDWCAHLAPGFTSAACHGVIRVGHAVRSLSDDEDSSLRRSELADALASWAAAYRPLPLREAARAPEGESDLRAALANITPVARAHRAQPGLIVAGYESLAHAPEFAAQVASVRGPQRLPQAVDELIVLSAEFLARSSQTPFHVIAFTHAVTGAAAVGNLLPVVSASTGVALWFRAWESTCAFKAGFVEREDELPRGGESWDVLIDRAVASGDDHLIKLTEASFGCCERTVADVLPATVLKALEILGA